MIIRIFGCAIALVSAVLLVLSVIALIDPVGKKLADDSDPFGPPSPWYVNASMLLASILFGGIGLWIAFRTGTPSTKDDSHEGVRPNRGGRSDSGAARGD